MNEQSNSKNKKMFKCYWLPSKKTEEKNSLKKCEERWWNVVITMQWMEDFDGMNFIFILIFVGNKFYVNFVKKCNCERNK